MFSLFFAKVVLVMRWKPMAKKKLNMKSSFSGARMSLFSIAFGLFGALVFYNTFALQPSNTQPKLPNTDSVIPFVEVPQKGLHWGGLKNPKAGSLCEKGDFEVAHGKQIFGCTHGPDPAPAYVNASQPNSTPPSINTTASLSTVICDGDGVSGKRVQPIYMHDNALPDNYNTYQAAITQYISNIDNALNTSAAKTGGSRHFRWVTNASCVPQLDDVGVPAAALADFGSTYNWLMQNGYGSNDRKLLVYADSNVYCGLANVSNQNTLLSSNSANNGRFIGRVDKSCWDWAGIHELMHIMGAVSTAAPHSTSSNHCWDEWDIMCYDDSTSNPLQYLCTNGSYHTGADFLYDCNNDDYFSTNPPAGNYLATHWNTANNIFIIGAAPLPDPPPAPTGLAGTYSSGAVQLTWNAVAGAVKYTIFKNGFLYTTSTTPSYTDTSVTSGTGYTYAVSAASVYGDGPISPAINVSTGGSAQPPPAPTGFITTSVTSAQVSLSWNIVSSASSYKIYRNNIQIASLLGNSYTDTSVSASTAYSYQVTSINSIGESAKSPPLSITTPAGGGGGTGVPGDVTGDGHVTITDLSVLLSHYGQSGQTLSTGDCNGDSRVTILDLSILLTNYGR
jgi:hypothetical protein